jgi:dipeptidyl aminopeptidase/acylaminoacyl peptidase
MAFTDAVLDAHPWIDAGRLGVAGGSYGGFMVNWIIGHTGRFKAAVFQRGIANMASMALLSDIGYFFVPEETGAGLWQDPSALWDQSPVKYAEKAVTPTLFIHSTEDYRCPVGEGIQMYTALQMAGVETRLCLFKGENHELSRSGKPLHRIRRLREIVEWFEHHLQQKAGAM